MFAYIKYLPYLCYCNGESCASSLKYYLFYSYYLPILYAPKMHYNTIPI
jgi:hypothetical protein